MKIEELKQKIEEEKNKDVCNICKGVGYVQEYKNKPVHCCWTCLREGKL